MLICTLVEGEYEGHGNDKNIHLSRGIMDKTEGCDTLAFKN